MSNFSTIKPKTVVFAKKGGHKILLTEQIINEMKPMEVVNVKVKVLSATDQKTINSSKLGEYVPTDDGGSVINRTILEELIDETDIDTTYSIFNLQVVTYNNQTNVKSTTRTIVNKQQNALSQINISGKDLLSTGEKRN